MQPGRPSLTAPRTIAVASALAVALVAAPAARAGAVVEIGVEDNFFTPPTVSTTLAANDITWIWDLDGSSGGTTVEPHDVVSRDDLFSSELSDRGTFDLTASAGRFRYFCTLHAEMTGQLRVAPINAAGGAGKAFRVAWSTQRASTGNRFDVRFKKGKGRWKDWKEDTRRLAATFGKRRKPVKVKAGRAYSFKARSQRGRGERRRSGWSPTLEVRT